MRCVFDQRQLAHAPEVELHNGGFVPYAEDGGRVASILDAIGATEPASDHGEDPLLAVHSGEYLDFLKQAYAAWRAAGREGDAMGYAWPVRGRRALDLERIDAKLGRFSFDTATPIAAGTWESAYWSAQTALTALDLVHAGGQAAFALCRPPGHHAGSDYLGGYCHINSAAVAAQAARTAGRSRVAVLDIDYHHGNGTQDIFYDRDDVFFASIHADPRTDYPFFWGHADERGEGDGEGATLNLPLPRGTSLAGYERALETALEAISDFGPDQLVLSYGADTYEGDPISQFRLSTGDFTRIAGRIAELGVPTLIVMEGGYAVDALGANVAAFLSGF
ncbi:histone deacetylase family protein [Qipengyuania sediminis]|uniref:histone deacetylase family protein n=1 Tax=Qipengyuania sediminis TaxID=1532023 RepID=UPI001059BB19|nr:histone deacetylase family protein [Qipengyuania sediminis]